MLPKFPLNDIIPHKVEIARTIEAPVYADDFWQINQNEFAMQVEGVGSFYACNGSEVEYAPAEGAATASVELYLNGSVYGAVLHQRKILPIHGSSFVWKERGIMLCGESGAGKSALTAAFSMAGAQFLTDDVTPVDFANGKPEILPLSDRIKLRGDSLLQLKQEKEGLTSIVPGNNKFYFPMEKSVHRNYPLHRVYIIEPADLKSIETIILQGIESFIAIRNEVYRWEYLQAMPETESGYLEKLLVMSRTIVVTRVKRPAGISIAGMMDFLKKELNENGNVYPE
jgi:hypothetical protein